MPVRPEAVGEDQVNDTMKSTEETRRLGGAWREVLLQCYWLNMLIVLAQSIEDTMQNTVD